MFLGSTPEEWTKFKSFLILLSLSTFAIAKSLSCESTPNVNVTSSGATLISAFPVTEMIRGWLQLSCAKSEGISVAQNARATPVWANFPFIGDVSFGETRRTDNACLPELYKPYGMALRSFRG